MTNTESADLAELVARIKARRAQPAADTTTPRAAAGAAATGTATAALSEAEYQEWNTLLAERLGLYFPPSRLPFLQDRLWGRVRANGLPGLSHYHAFLASHPSEWEALADVITVNESRFFRQEGAFKALQEQILPELVRRRETAQAHGHGQRRLLLWSAGCSTGDEAYTLAMTVLETVPLPTIWELRVLGTDLSPRNVALAREGVYTAQRLESLPRPWLARYAAPLATKTGDAAAGRGQGQQGQRYRMGETVRALTSFRVHNLCDTAWPVAQQDLIVCQNVLIYFRRQEQLRVLSRLYDTLNPGGYLLVGATELPTEPLQPGLWPSRIGDALVYCKP